MNAFSRIAAVFRLARAIAALVRAERRNVYWTLRSSQLTARACYLVELREIGASGVTRWHPPVLRASPLEALEAAVAYLASPAGGAV